MKGFLSRLCIALLWTLLVIVPGRCADALRVGLTLDLSGPYMELGLMHRRAYELWRDEVNLRGGIRGRMIELVLVDDGGDADRAVAIYNDLIEQQHVDLVLSPYSSEITTKIAPLVDREGYPMLAAGASSDRIWQQGYTHVFGVMSTASRYSQGMLRLALRNGLSRISIIYAPDEFSTQAGEGTRKWARYARLNVVYEQKLPTKGGSMEEALARARAAGAELIMIAGHLTDAIAARTALAKIGWEPRAFYATIGPALPVWIDKVGPLAEGTFSTSLWEPINSDDFPGASDFARRFRERFGIAPSYQAATAFASGQILEAAIAAAGSLDRGKIRDALSHLDTYSIQGRFAVDRSGMQVKRIEMIIQWQKGQKQIVWPPELKTADPVFHEAVP